MTPPNMDDNSGDRLTVARRFLERSNSTHRQYEALRPFFVDGLRYESPSGDAIRPREARGMVWGGSAVYTEECDRDPIIPIHRVNHRADVGGPGGSFRVVA
jgi:hypothetical protein